MDDYGQVSAEMIVLLAAVIAVAYVVVSSLYNTANDTQQKLKGTSNRVSDKIQDIENIV